MVGRVIRGLGRVVRAIGHEIAATIRFSAPVMSASRATGGYGTDSGAEAIGVVTGLTAMRGRDDGSQRERPNG